MKSFTFEQNHSILDILESLNISNKNNFFRFSDKVRDRDDICAYKCSETGIIILNKTSHINNYYSNKPESPFYKIDYNEKSLLTNNEDDLRRADQFRSLILQRTWCDFGTGLGNLLNLLDPVSKKTIAVELQKSARDFIQNKGFKCYENIEEYLDKDLDVVTLFHVFEHLDKPIEVLKSLKSKMTDGGKIIIEVPHANDILLQTFKLESFKDFTLWSEHLILHTKVSLKKMIEAAGFKDVIVCGFQRYGLSNHLYWLNHNKPGGHKEWMFLNSDQLNKEYSNILISSDMSDTLIAYASA